MLRMLMRQDVAQTIGRLFRTGLVPTAAQKEELRALRSRAASRKEGTAASSSEPENYTVVGNTAEIRVTGVLSEYPDFWAWLMGIEQTSYEDIRDALALASANPLVSKVILTIDSPGGYVDGLFDTLGAIEAFNKPINVVASNAASAAYAIAAMAGPIQARGVASSFGSVGVVTTYYVDPTQVDITSTDAPNKRPDVTTEDGRAVVRAELDALHEIFVEAIARGRSNATGKTFTVDQINADFGRGGEMLPDAAKAAGMIDKLAAKPKRGGAKASADEDGEEPAPAPARLAIAPAPTTAPQALNQPPCAAGQANRKKPMTEEELLAQFPALHAAMIAKGAAQGQASERKRVSAHLKMAKACGAMDIAEKAIASGVSITDEEVFADYQTAAIGKRETSARQVDSDEAGKVIEGAAQSASTARDLGDEVADRLEAQMGKTKKAS